MSDSSPRASVPSALALVERIKQVARDIGAVHTVALRRSDPDPDHKAMLTMLDQWRLRLFDITDELAVSLWLRGCESAPRPASQSAAVVPSPDQKDDDVLTRHEKD